MNKAISDEIKKLFLDDIESYEIRNKVASGVLCRIIGSCYVDESEVISYERLLEFVKDSIKDYED